jgi:hypothetical protein
MTFEESARQHLAQIDLDLRKKPEGFSRYMDQKVTPDVLAFIADCIVNFVGGKDPNTIFTTKDIWGFQYFQKNTVAIFGKPSPTNESASSEYDKFIAQPLKTLAFAKILKEEKDFKKLSLPEDQIVQLLKLGYTYENACAIISKRKIEKLFDKFAN